MNTRLFTQALIKLLTGVLLVGLLLFLPAGTFSYWQAWLLMAILFVPMLLAGMWLMVSNPELLRKRLNAKENQDEQKTVVSLSGLLFVVVLVVAGLNYRFQWLMLPDWTTYVAAALFLLGYVMYCEVMRENTWLSRTVEVQEHQQVISTGLYGLVRHPMYAATMLMFLTMPIVLNSFFSFVIILFYIPLIRKRIRNEEKVLEKELPGYMEYKKRVRYKLFPYVW